MMSLLNTKILLVIAALLVAIGALLTRQEARANAEEQRRQAVIQAEKKMWADVDAAKKKLPCGLCGMEETIKKSQRY